MRNKSIRTILLLFTSILFSACFTDVIIDVDEEKNLLVLNAWLTAGESPKVSVYASKSIFESGYENDKLSNVNLMIYEGEQEVGLLTQNEQGIYVSEQITIEANKTYTFRASHAKYPNAVAVITIPEAINPEAIKITHITKGVTEFDYTYTQSDVNLSLIDEAESDDYYAIAVLYESLYYDENNSQDTLKYSNLSGGLNSLDPQVDYLYVGYGQMIGITDDFFNGGTYNNTFSSYGDLGYYESDNGGNYYVKESNSIVVYKLNKALYQYFLTLENNQFPTPFTEPTQVYSNVEGGYGIIGAASSFVVPIEDERVNNFY